MRCLNFDFGDLVFILDVLVDNITPYREGLFELIKDNVAVYEIKVQAASVGLAVGSQLFDAPFNYVSRIKHARGAQLLNQIDNLRSHVVNVLLVKTLCR